MTDDEVAQAGMSDDDVAQAMSAQPKPSFGQRLTGGLSRIGGALKEAGSAVFGDSPLASAIRAPEGQRLSAAGGAFKRGFNPARIDQSARGLDDAVTLGYGQKLADFANRKLHGATEEQQQSLEAERAQQAPGYRTAGNLVGQFVPGASNLLGKAGGAATSKLTGGMVAKNPLMAAALGAGRAGIGYEASVPAMAGLSASSSGHRLEAAADAATDPAGLAVAGAFGAGAEGGRAAGRRYLVDPAPDRLLGSIAQPDESISAAPKSLRRKMAKQQDNVVKAVTSDPELASVIHERPEVRMPVITRKLNEAGQALDPHYDIIDKALVQGKPKDLSGLPSLPEGVSELPQKGPKTAATGIGNPGRSKGPLIAEKPTGPAGWRTGDLVHFVGNKLDELRKKPGNEAHIAALEDAEASLLQAFDPDTHAMLTAKGLGKYRQPGIERQFAGMHGQRRVHLRELREYVTKLQTEGSRLTNTADPSANAKMRGKLAGDMKEFLDSQLDLAAKSPDPQVKASVDWLRNEGNPRYSALKRIHDTSSEAGVNQKTKSRSLKSVMGDTALAVGAGYEGLVSHSPIKAGAMYLGGKVIQHAAPYVAGKANLRFAKMSQKPAGTGPMVTANPILRAAEAKKERDREKARHLGAP